MNRPTPHPDGPFAQPPERPAIPEYDWKGLSPDYIGGCLNAAAFGLLLFLVVGLILSALGVWK